MRYFVAVFATLVGACGDDGPTTCLPDCAGDRSYDAVAYDLHAEIDWTTFEVTAHEDITLTVGASPVVELDAAPSIAISRVHSDKRELDSAFDPATNKLRVDLTPLAPKSDPVTFTIDYVASPTDALLVGGGRDDDPVTSLVEFTDSEPDRGVQWLVAKHDPADRALWSIDMTLPAGLDLIANGARLADDPDGAGHVVRYALDKPIPTYLMAFAAGDLVHDDRTTGRVPLSIWHRRGLAIDSTANLDAIADAMATFEKLAGPYPWDSYSVVLAPQYGGGMENATITFNAETSGFGNVGFSLNAHELAHHWFGDWVTMKTYDDVWFKEGMATLLQSEAQRATRDRGATGRLFGHDMSFSNGDAIVDPDLHGLDKYTSGPYQRSSWTITQIRSLVGEDVFWASLRKMLADHALDSITGETFLRSFSPALDEATIQKLLAAITSHDSPSISVTSSAVTGGTSSTLTVADPGGTLITPIGITVVDAAGGATLHSVTAGTPLTVTVPTGGYLAADESDVHPYFPFSFDVTGYDALIAVELPASAPATTAWDVRSAAHQELSLDDAGLPSPVPADVLARYNAVDSTNAQRSVVFDGCLLLGSLADATAMEQALAPLIQTPVLPTFNTRFAACGTTLPGALGTELAQLADAVTPTTAGRLDYLMSFDYGAASFAAISKIATTAPNLLLRDRAVSRLALQTVGVYSPVPQAQAPAWQAFFRDQLKNRVTSQNRLLSAWRGVLGLADVTALPLVAPLLHSVPMNPFFQRQIACDAFSLAQGTPGAWEAFQQATQPWDTLPSEVSQVLADPTKCNSQRTAPARSTKTAREARSLGSENR
jgi:hypothetical protein